METQYNTFQNSHSFTICGWMVNKLNLEGYNLMVYAIIFGCTQGLQGCNKRGLFEYIASAVSLETDSVQHIVEELLELKVINYTYKISNGETIEEYTINREAYA